MNREGGSQQRREEVRRDEPRSIGRFGVVKIMTTLRDDAGIEFRKDSKGPYLSIRSLGVIPVKDRRVGMISALELVVAARKDIANLEEAKKTLSNTGQEVAIAALDQPFRQTQEIMEKRREAFFKAWTGTASVETFVVGHDFYEIELTEPDKGVPNIALHFKNWPWPEEVIANGDTEITTRGQSRGENGRIWKFHAYRDRMTSMVIISGDQYLATMTFYLREPKLRCLVATLDVRAAVKVELTSRLLRSGTEANAEDVNSLAEHFQPTAPVVKAIEEVVVSLPKPPAAFTGKASPRRIKGAAKEDRRLAALEAAEDAANE